MIRLHPPSFHSSASQPNDTQWFQDYLSAIEQHIVRGPEKIFPPGIVNRPLESEAQSIA